MRNEYEEARIAFYEIKDKDQKYSTPATYYYAHIAYVQQNYETALNGFIKLSNDETFSPVVPYYITQIYYLQKRWDELLKYAPPLLELITENITKIKTKKIINQGKFPELFCFPYSSLLNSFFARLISTEVDASSAP